MAAAGDCYAGQVGGDVLITNVTVKRELYEVERDGNTIEYDGMTMERVDRPTAECAAALDKAPLPTPLP